MTTSDPLSNLNPAQKEAVQATKGPVLILAGAGAGKTKTLTERIRHLIRSGVAPSKILAITFTNKAAKEMRERVDRGLKEDKRLNLPIEMGERPFVSTFHALGVHILREQGGKIGIKKHFSILDRDDSKRAVKEALEKKGLDPKTHDPNRILGIISKEKGRGITAEEYGADESKGYFANIVEEIWAEYEKILARDNALDFDDLLLKTRNILRNHSEVREHYTRVWEYIMIDEYQDTNRVQYEISKMLIGPAHNICAVGDIDQNIYSWRGADIKNILDFEKDYPEAKIVVLEHNYRSTKTILDAANIIIKKNKIRREKNLTTNNKPGEKIGIYSGFDEVNEAEYIAKKTSELISQGISADEIAVLYRANFQSRVLEEGFMRAGLPYQLLGTRFFERREVKDIVAYLRGALNPECLADIKRVINTPARGIGKVTIAKVFSGQKDSLPASTRRKVENFYKLLEEIREVARRERPSETVRYIIKTSGLEDEWKESKKDEDADRLENAYELANFASKYDPLEPEEGVLAFLADAALQSDQDELKEEEKAVRLMTVHASKGLEFSVVFVSGLEDGLFPHQRVSEGGLSPEEAEEERRLFYVAITRAKERLFLSYAQTRFKWGRKEVNIPSEFIFDIPDEYLNDEEFEENENVRRKPLLDIEF